MRILARYPSPDPQLQRGFDDGVQLARIKISKFQLTNALFDNFTRYDGLPYTSITNIILHSCIPGGYGSENIELLERSIEYFDISQWSPSKYNAFQRRITDNDLSVSESVFLEITTAYGLGQKIGKDNITYEPRVSEGKKPDILACVKSKKIFLELTSVGESKAERKIQAVADDAAEYMYEKVKNKNPTRVCLFMDSTELKQSGRHIDEEKSKKHIRSWIDKLELDKLVGAKGSIPLNELKNYPGIGGLLQQRLSECHLRCVQNLEEYDKQKTIHSWASSKSVLDVVSSPFASIFFENYCYSSIRVHVSSLHTTDDDLSNWEPTTAIKTANLEEQSFLDQIKRKIHSKIKERQYSKDLPVVFLIKANAWFSLYETDHDDFTKVKNIVEKSLECHPYISGVLLYKSSYTSGRFIHNPIAGKQIRLSEYDATLLFSDGRCPRHKIN